MPSVTTATNNECVLQPLMQDNQKAEPNLLDKSINYSLLPKLSVWLPH